MTKKLVGLFASVALLSSGLAMANNEGKSKSQTQSSQQLGGDASGQEGTGGDGSEQGAPTIPAVVFGQGIPLDR